MLIVKKSDSYRLFTISDTKTRDDEKITLFAKSCIFIFGVNTPTQKKTWQGENERYSWKN